MCAPPPCSRPTFSGLTSYFYIQAPGPLATLLAAAHESISNFGPHFFPHKVGDCRGPARVESPPCPLIKATPRGREQPPSTSVWTHILS